MSQNSSAMQSPSSSLGDLAGIKFVRPWHVLLAAAGCIGISIVLISWVDRRVERQKPAIEGIRKGHNDLAVQISHGQNQAEQFAEQLNASETQLSEALAEIRTMQQEVSARRLTATLTSVNAGQLIRQIDRIDQSLADLTSNLLEWQGDRASLLTDGRGCAIAQSDESLQRFVILDSQSIPSLRDVESWQTDLARLRTSLVVARDATGVEIAQVPDGFQETIDQLESRTTDASTRLLALRNHVERIPPGHNTSAGDETLEDAIQRNVEERQRNREEALVAVIEEVHSQYSRQMQEEAAATQRLIEERALKHTQAVREEILEAQKLDEKIELQQLAELRETARQQEEHRQASAKATLETAARRARMKQSMPLIRQYLAPCITPASRQLNGSKWVYSDTKVPLSLSGIRAYGALENTPRGYERMYWIGGGDQNDRPDGVFESYIGGAIYDNEVPKVRTAQRLLTEFGDLLVADGLLSP